MLIVLVLVHLVPVLVMLFQGLGLRTRGSLPLHLLNPKLPAQFPTNIFKINLLEFGSTFYSSRINLWLNIPATALPQSHPCTLRLHLTSLKYSLIPSILFFVFQGIELAWETGIIVVSIFLSYLGRRCVDFKLNTGLNGLQVNFDSPGWFHTQLGEVSLHDGSLASMIRTLCSLIRLFNLFYSVLQFFILIRPLLNQIIFVKVRGHGTHLQASPLLLKPPYFPEILPINWLFQPVLRVLMVRQGWGQWWQEFQGIWLIALHL